MKVLGYKTPLEVVNGVRTGSGLHNCIFLLDFPTSIRGLNRVHPSGKKAFHDIRNNRKYSCAGLTPFDIMIDHVTISVSDLAKSKAFYEKVLAPLFNNVLHESCCHLLSSKAYSNGLVQIHYEIAKQ